MLILKISSWLLVCAISSVLYRAGGMSKDATTKPKWIPVWLRRSWVRDWLCPACVSLVLLSFWWPSSFLSWGLLLLSYILCGLALSTYYDTIFGFDNYWFHGFMIGLAAFPLFWGGIAWYAIMGRAILLGALVGGWSTLIKVDWIEEIGRGLLITGTVPFFLFLSWLVSHFF